MKKTAKCLIQKSSMWYEENSKERKARTQRYLEKRLYAKWHTKNSQSQQRTDESSSI